MKYRALLRTGSASVAVGRSWRFPPDVEVSICCHRSDLSGLAGLFTVLGWPSECQKRGGAWMDWWMAGLWRWRGDGPQERWRVGGSWRGPLAPLNWHVRAPGLVFNKTCDNIQYSWTFGDIYCLNLRAFNCNYWFPRSAHSRHYEACIIIPRRLLSFHIIWGKITNTDWSNETFSF